MAAVHSHHGVLTRVKLQLYLSGILSHCVRLLALDPRRLRGNWSAATTLAQLVRYPLKGETVSLEMIDLFMMVVAWKYLVPFNTTK